jgi:formylglycine-generating enzyme
MTTSEDKNGAKGARHGTSASPTGDCKSEIHPMRMLFTLLAVGLCAVPIGCKCDGKASKTKASAVALQASAAAAPAATALLPELPSALASAIAPEPQRHCPRDMVLIQNRTCVDRYESSLVDVGTGQALSPYYPVLADYKEFLLARQREAQTLEAGDAGRSAAVPMPELSPIQASGKATPKAVSRAGTVPNGHLTMPVAKAACEAAGKRLCSLEEWQRACRGQSDQKFPYGPEYRPRQCNVFREDHPGHILYGNFSVGMQDPRMGTVETAQGPLLRKTGQTSSCVSRWGDDAIYDMVGNLDEWIDDPEGTFVGGFFSRATKEGCDEIVTAHAANYRDYSIGARCCSDAK